MGEARRGEAFMRMGGKDCDRSNSAKNPFEIEDFYQIMTFCLNKSID
jgi:hypothetical protein